METLAPPLKLIDASSISQIIWSQIVVFAKKNSKNTFPKVRIPNQQREKPRPERDKRPVSHPVTNNGNGSHKK